MAEEKNIQTTLGGTPIGGGRDDMESGDYSRGYYDAAPVGNYEGSLSPDVSYDFRDGKMIERKLGTLHPGMIEADGFVRTHGDMDEWGFVRRPTRRSDVERI